MKDVLHRTVRSLEKALKSNPNDIELKVALAECYVQVGRFDHRTMEFYKAILTQRPNNPLLQQALSIGMLVKQSHEIENDLRNGAKPAAFNVIGQSIESLDEYLSQSSECVDAWIALTRFHILAGKLMNGCGHAWILLVSLISNHEGCEAVEENARAWWTRIFPSNFSDFQQNTTYNIPGSAPITPTIARTVASFMAGPTSWREDRLHVA